ncbi:hypothetical protein Q0M53_13745, partial [Staphylococcus aureus]|nr:hypothetical protein [Staphylococcus aureus]
VVVAAVLPIVIHPLFVGTCPLVLIEELRCLFPFDVVIYGIRMWIVGKTGPGESVTSRFFLT